MRLVSLALAALMAVVPAAATAQSNALLGNRGASDASLMPDVSFKTIAPVLQQMGAQVRMVTIQGSPVLTAALNGRRIAFLENCDPSGPCYGLRGFALIDDVSSQRAVDAFNQTYLPARAIYLGNDGIMLDRYYIADHGLVTKTFQRDVEVFAASVGKWFALTDPRQASDAGADITRTVSFDPLLPPGQDGSSVLNIPGTASADTQFDALVRGILANEDLLNRR